MNNIISILFKAGTVFGQITALLPELELNFWVEPDLTLHIEQKDMAPDIRGFKASADLLACAEEMYTMASIKKDVAELV